jgi:hypothetical protein
MSFDLGVHAQPNLTFLGAEMTQNGKKIQNRKKRENDLKSLAMA